MIEAYQWIVLWLNPDYGELLHRVVSQLSWTRAEHSDISHLASNILNWTLRAPLNEGILVEILESFGNTPNDAWAIAFVREPGTWIEKNLAQLHGQIAIDERIAAALPIPLHWDHPLGDNLRRMHLGLWNRRDFREQKADDLAEALRRMRNVPPSHEHSLDYQEVEIRLPQGTNPADYAAIAYADIPDGGSDCNGVGGRNVLLFHSAMTCGRDPFTPNGEVLPLPLMARHGRPIEGGRFVFLNTAAAGVKHYSVNPTPNNLVDHLLNRRISVEQVVGGPDHHVQYRSDPEE